MKKILLAAFILVACSSDNSVSSKDESPASSSSNGIESSAGQSEFSLDFDDRWPDLYTTLSSICSEYHFAEGEITEVTFDIWSPEANKLNLKNVKGEITDMGNGWWKFSAPSDFYEKNKIEDGDYQIQWYIKGKPSKDSPLDSTSASHSIVLDRVSPEYELTIHKPVVSQENGLHFIQIVPKETEQASKITRFLRVFAVNKETKDTLVLFNTRNVFSEKFVNFKSGKSEWSGAADLYIQGFDNATPNRELSNLFSKIEKDSTKSPWSDVIHGDSFVEGINGTTIHKEIFIDDAPPAVSALKIDLISATIDDIPEFQKIQGDDELLLNKNDTLNISFDISKKLFDQESTIVDLQIILNDSIRDYKRTFEYQLAMKDSVEHFEFKETEDEQIRRDGIYSLSIVMKDERENVLTHSWSKTVRVDRTAPSIMGVETWNVQVPEFSELHDSATVFLNQLGDIEENRSDLSCFIRKQYNQEKSAWKSIGTESKSKTGVDQTSYQFEYLDMMSESDSGTVIFYAGCFDAAANFYWKTDFFSIGE